MCSRQREKVVDQVHDGKFDERDANVTDVSRVVLRYLLSPSRIAVILRVPLESFTAVSTEINQRGERGRNSDR